MDKNLASIEMIREAASLLMLLSVSILTGRSAITKFAFFIYSFAVWDIFFYVFLKILTGWPESLMTTDILFLLPVIWVGPVLAPLIISLVMILLALLIFYFSSVHKHVELKIYEILILTAGALLTIISFTADYTRLILSNYSFVNIWKQQANNFIKLSVNYFPGNFYWTVFVFGIIFMLTGIGLFAQRNILINDQ